MTACASVAVLWGATVVAVAQVRRGAPIAVTADGVVSPLRGRAEDGSLVVRVEGSEARVVAVGQADRAERVVRIGDRAEIALTPLGSAGVYRRAGDWASDPLAIEVTVSEDASGWLRRRTLAARAWGTIASSTALHLAALGVCAMAMPPAAPPSSQAALAAPMFFPELPLSIAMERDPDVIGSAGQICLEDFHGPPVGQSISVAGPQDNPDPHLARHSTTGGAWTSFHPPYSPDHGWGDARAPMAFWGRDDSLGNMDHSDRSIRNGPRDYRDFSTCFAPPPPEHRCGDELPDPPSLERLALAGIGTEQTPLTDAPRRKRPPRVALGPIAVSANIPRWMVTGHVREIVERSRVCYERALVDDPTLTGGVNVVLRMRDYDRVEAHLTFEGDARDDTAFRCCAEASHELPPYASDAPRGTRATAVYSITFGLPPSK